MEQDEDLMAVLMVVLHATIQYHGTCDVQECVQTAKKVINEVKKENEQQNNNDGSK